MSSPRLILISGANGAGKSTLTKRLGNRFGDRFGQLIDPDAVAKLIAPEHPRSAGVQAARAVLHAIDLSFERRERLVIETTLSERNRHTDVLQKARSLGYKTWLFYIGLRDVDLHMERVQQRFFVGGHDVPDADILRRFERSRANLPAAIWLADRTMIYDNSGRDFKLVASLEYGNLRRSSGTGWWTPLLPVSEE